MKEMYVSSGTPRNAGDLRDWDPGPSVELEPDAQPCPHPSRRSDQPSGPATRMTLTAAPGFNLLFRPLRPRHFGPYEAARRSIHSFDAGSYEPWQKPSRAIT